MIHHAETADTNSTAQNGKNEQKIKQRIKITQKHGKILRTRYRRNEMDN